MSAARTDDEAGPPLVGPRRPLVGPRPGRRARRRWVVAAVLPVAALVAVGAGWASGPPSGDTGGPTSGADALAVLPGDAAEPAPLSPDAAVAAGTGDASPVPRSTPSPTGGSSVVASTAPTVPATVPATTSSTRTTGSSAPSAAATSSPGGPSSGGSLFPFPLLPGWLFPTAAPGPGTTAAPSTTAGSVPTTDAGPATEETPAPETDGDQVSD